MPRVSRNQQIRKWFENLLSLCSQLLYGLYSMKPLPWPAIFSTHQLALAITGHFWMCSTRPSCARLRILAATVSNSLFPPSPEVLDSTHVVYVVWSPWSRWFYIGKVIDFRQRLRRHLNGFLKPEVVPQQPYMVLLSSRAGGDSCAAASQYFFTPIAACPSDEDTIRLETFLINTLHPPLNEPYATGFSSCVASLAARL
jgi:hypothetical protein